MATQLLASKGTRLFMVLGGFFIANALLAEFIGIKIFSLEKLFGYSPLGMTLFGVEGLGFDLTAGVLIWPVVFVMTDIINEYFGKKGVRFLSWLAVILISYAFLIAFLAILTPPNDWWQFVSGIRDDPGESLTDMDLAYARVFGQGMWIIAGSVIAFLGGQLLDVIIFHKIRRATGGKKIWLRATASTLVSQLIDSFVVLIIAFYIGSDWDLIRVLAIGVVNYSYKFAMAILLIPAIYGIHYMIEGYLGHDLAGKMKADAASH
ncbi:MAG TPA: queuosine precursor transporter [Chitinophagaceae bacterium]|nr:queuosine precursor transporter [Chitinophagaceae bacterium]